MITLITKIVNIQIETILLSMIILLGVLIFLLSLNLRKVKKQNKYICSISKLMDTFVDADSDMIYLKDENLNYVLLNQAIMDFFNKTKSEIIGHNDFDLAEKEFAILNRKTDNKVQSEKITIVDEIKWNNKIFQATKFPVTLSNGKIGVGAQVREVTEEYNNKKRLEEKNQLLKVSEENLQLILDSTADGIYGIDLDGNCTFCNKSALNLLRLNSQDEVLGKNSHTLFHHSRKDGTHLALEDCKILMTFKENMIVHVDDEVFWRSDGTYFEVEYFSYPKYFEGKLVGVVVTFMDISERRKAERDLLYLSYYDIATGLYNRRYIEEKINSLDKESNLPISIIMGDLNGLKQTNDIFGHNVGDLLIQKIADVMKLECRSDDIIGRIGGDEFIIILPNTGYSEVKLIAERIKAHVSKEQVGAINCSISLGYATKNAASDNLSQIMREADEKMYGSKTLDRKNYSNATVRTIIESIHDKFPSERLHSENVSQLCADMGKKLNLSTSEITRLRNAGYLHDIGKIVLEASILNNAGCLNDEELEQIKEHPIKGYRILNSSDETLELAKYVLSHHERWDGTGYPNRLFGDTIPKISRIIALAESYDAMTSDSFYKKPISKKEAILELQKGAGSQFDPELVPIFIEMLNESSKK